MRRATIIVTPNTDGEPSQHFGQEFVGADDSVCRFMVTSVGERAGNASVAGTVFRAGPMGAKSGWSGSVTSFGGVEYLGHFMSDFVVEGFAFRSSATNNVADAIETGGAFLSADLLESWDGVKMENLA